MSHPTLGDVTRARRELEKVSLRQLARMAVISNPTLHVFVAVNGGPRPRSRPSGRRAAQGHRQDAQA